MNHRPRTCNKLHKWGREMWAKTSTGWWTRTIWTCNNCMAMKVIVQTLQEDGVETSYEQIVEPDPPEPYVPEPFSPFGRPASGFYPITHEDLKYLQGEPDPLKISIPITIEEPDKE